MSTGRGTVCVATADNAGDARRDNAIISSTIPSRLGYVFSVRVNYDSAMLFTPFISATVCVHCGYVNRAGQRTTMAGCGSGTRQWVWAALPQRNKLGQNCLGVMTILSSRAVFCQDCLVVERLSSGPAIVGDWCGCHTPDAPPGLSA